MAFLTTNSGGDGGDRRPVISYNAKAGRLFLLDRTQASDGAWTTNKVDITMSQPTFALDFGSIEVGWMFFSQSAAPSVALVPYGQPLPPKPPNPGVKTTEGKEASYKQGFRLLCVGSQIGGVREMMANSGATIEGLGALHTAYEAAPEAAADMIPLVKMTGVTEVRAGQATNFMPVFEIVRWVQRPADLLGPRTVPIPRGGARTSAAPATAAPAATAGVVTAAGAATARPAGHVEPPPPPAPPPPPPPPAKAELSEALPF